MPGIIYNRIKENIEMVEEKLSKHQLQTIARFGGGDAQLMAEELLDLREQNCAGCVTSEGYRGKWLVAVEALTTSQAQLQAKDFVIEELDEALRLVADERDVEKKTAEHWARSYVKANREVNLLTNENARLATALRCIRGFADDAVNTDWEPVYVGYSE